MAQMKCFFKFLLIILFAFTACAKKTPELVFSVGGAPNELDFWEEIISDFEKEKGIKVRILRQPTDSDQRRQGILIPMKAKIENPDIFLMDIAWIPQFAASNWLLPLDEYVQRDKYSLKPFWKNILDLSDTYKNNIVALPVYIDAGVLYYRKDLLKKYGFQNPPSTWSEFLKISKKIQKAEREKNSSFFAFVWQGAQYEGLICNFLEFASLDGGGFSFKGKLKINTSANIKAADFMKDLINKWKLSPPNTYTDMKEEQVRMFFQSGNALFERNWPYAWGLHQSDNSEIKGKVAIAALPYFKGGKSVSTLGGWHIGISRFSDSKDEAWAFMKYVVSKKVQKSFCLKLGWNPARKDVYSDAEILKKYPHFKDLKNVFGNASPRPAIPYYTQVSDVLQRHINSIVAGKTDSKEAFNQAEFEIKNIIERYE
ncbi:MAG: ABC transporter substrate-binding protein [Elusimicrobiales bacterium]|nr:ABC transporter substrate-binding protein [Elusimicrobiales bacterium]